jgi:hypothetical protein
MLSSCSFDTSFILIFIKLLVKLGADPGGRGGTPARAPPKIGKNMIFWRKIVIFHTKYPK